MKGGPHPSSEVMASWPAPNYIDPQTHGQAILYISCTLGPFTIAIVAARLWARFGIQRNGGIDDILLLLSLVPVMGMIGAVNLVSEVYELDRHIWDVQPDVVIAQRKFSYAIFLLTLYSMTIVRISVLLFYRRLADRTVSRSFCLAIWATLGINIVYTIILTILTLIGCHPISAFWNEYKLSMGETTYAGRCGNEALAVLIAVALSLLLDFLTTTLPAILCWKLHISLREKAALGAVFAAGYIVCIIAALRVYSVYQAYWGSSDFTWKFWDIYLLTILELLVGAICASLPALKVFWRYYFTDQGIQYASGDVSSGRGSRTSAGRPSSSKLSFQKGFWTPTVRSLSRSSSNGSGKASQSSRGSKTSYASDERKTGYGSHGSRPVMGQGYVTQHRGSGLANLHSDSVGQINVFTEITQTRVTRSQLPRGKVALHGQNYMPQGRSPAASEDSLKEKYIQPGWPLATQPSSRGMYAQYDHVDEADDLARAREAQRELSRSRHAQHGNVVESGDRSRVGKVQCERLETSDDVV